MFGNNCTDKLHDFYPRLDFMVVDVQNQPFAEFSEQDLEKMLARLRAHKQSDSYRREMKHAAKVEAAEAKVAQAKAEFAKLRGPDPGK